jgi:hypothetical protein
VKSRLAMLLSGLALAACDGPSPESSPEEVFGPQTNNTTEKFDALTGALVCKLPSATNTALPAQVERRFTGVAGTRAGTALAAGDIDGNGKLELLIGAPGGTASLKGYAHVVPTTTAAGALDIRTYSTRYEGEVGGNRLGAALAVGNFTGTAGNDLILGAPGYSTPLAGAGVVYPVNGAQIVGGDRALTTTNARFRGANANDGAGSAMTVGNVTGSASPDLIVGVPFNENTSSAPNTGTVYVFPGPVTSSVTGLLNSAPLKIFGAGISQTDVQAGASVAVADVDGDRNDDLIVGAPRLDVGSTTDAGAIYVFFGPLTGPTKSIADAELVLTGVNAGELAGTAVTNAGDLNGDGYQDLLVGAPGSTGMQGRAYLVYGGPRPAAPPQAAVSLGTKTVFTGIANDQAGAAVASPGDLNGDGHADLLVGAPNHTSGAGAVYVVYGSSTGFPASTALATGPRYVGTAGSQTGSALVGLGDVDNDGANDFAVGSPGFSSGAGAVHLVVGYGPRDWYTDADGDRFGLDGSAQERCGDTVTPGFALSAGDCNDGNLAINPGAAEVCDGIDNNCDGLRDDDLGANPSNPSQWFLDADGDKHVDFAISQLQCAAPGPEWITQVFGEECATSTSDSDATVYQGAPEICDEKDNNCDGNIDDDQTRWPSWYRDADRDGYGNPAQTVSACVAPNEYVANNQDCDDTDVQSRPGGTEVCDGKDNNCSGVIDEGVKTTFYLDADHDGHGTVHSSTQACSVPANHSLLSDDCDDGSAQRFPGNAEVCDAIDNNCNFDTDEGVKRVFYRDADNDTFGTPLSSTLACVAPSGYVASNTDCNDANGAVRPNATEVCDSIDNNCNGTVDEGVKRTFYADADGDGAGTTQPNFRVEACVAPAGYVTTSTDCNDARGDVRPGAAELCDDLDNNCNSSIDEGLATSNWYLDSDGDGYGGQGTTAVADCRLPAPGYVNNNSDCNDTNRAVNPLQAEVCEPTGQAQVDNNCDGNTENAANATTWYRDADGDGYGAKAISLKRCTQPAGYVEQEQDCNDANASTNPGSNEVCEAGGPTAQVDNDCDVDTNDVDPNRPVENGGAPMWYGDADRDGHAGTTFKLRWCTNPTDFRDPVTNVLLVQGAYVAADPDDCNDSSSGVFQREMFYEDKDGDGCGNPARGGLYCGSPGGCGFSFVRNNKDPNDNVVGDCAP